VPYCTSEKGNKEGEKKKTKGERTLFFGRKREKERNNNKKKRIFSLVS